jgi:hypothetical protein
MKKTKTPKIMASSYAASTMREVNTTGHGVCNACEKEFNAPCAYHQGELAGQELSANAPKGMITFDVTPSKVRHIANKNRRRDISNEDAKNFINLFGEDLEKALMRSFTEFVDKYFVV